MIFLTKYEELLDSATTDGVDIIQRSFNSNRIKGLYCDGTIALNENIELTSERRCILAEELGHHATAIGNIINQSSVSNRKQELRGRIIAYNRLIGLQGIISAYKAGCSNAHEVAEYLDVTEDFLLEALNCYRHKYGTCTTFDNYTIYFEPNIAVLELL